MKMYAALGVLAGLSGLAVWFLRGGPKLPPDTDAIIQRVSCRDVTHVVSGEVGYAESSGVRIWYEIIPSDGPEKGTVLFNIGMGGDSLFWPPSFIRRFTRAGYRVIRYDQRGTGASDWMPDWSRAQPYSLLDMAEDAVAVLDAAMVDKAHVLGLSLGGFVAQEIAIAHPARVASLTLLSTAADPTDTSLPGPRTGDLVRTGLAVLPVLRYRLLGGEANLVKERVAKMMGAKGYEDLDVEEMAELVLYDLRYRRGVNLRALMQHQAAVTVTRSRYEALRELRVPALIVHGTADALLPVEHAHALAELIPGAQTLWLEGVGHQFPYPDMVAVMDAVVSHLDSGTVELDQISGAD
ncbi:alpha/beta fold hydrolase [Tessaracoccus caeni]|uniref:alpha/beta fold hydrolase n=1 Tax=Tessaracoccus caeni TaxID=3031239 RepID=UPI0023DACB71|nr:alpha/beta hydrolase [Tessaracoccus caeni]MDF1488594.1 alpha/beta hydrolase [Tessaracoccus caeni]